jgi:hypothetical protein
VTNEGGGHQLGHQNLTVNGRAQRSSEIKNDLLVTLKIVRWDLVLIVTKPANLVLEPGDLFAQFA